MDNKDDLKKWLRENSSPEEQVELDALDEKESQTTKLENIEKGVSQFGGEYKALTSILSKVLKSIQASSEESQRAALIYAEIAKGINSRIETLATAKPNKDLSGFFKDFSTQMGQWGTSAKNTEDLIRNLKWNASQQLRDVNGSPVNPAIAPFGITVSYDDIKLTYTGDNITQVDYYQANKLKATLVLTYSGDNLIEVNRTH